MSVPKTTLQRKPMRPIVVRTIEPRDAPSPADVLRKVLAEHKTQG